MMQSHTVRGRSSVGFLCSVHAWLYRKRLQRATEGGINAREPCLLSCWAKSVAVLLQAWHTAVLQRGRASARRAEERSW